jgi:hypothetical protein
MRIKIIAKYIDTNSDTLSSDDVDFLLSWLDHSNYTAGEIISMLSEDEENAE